jgi:ribokinase
VEKCTQLDHRKKLSTLFIIGNACRDTTYRVAALPRPGETTLALATAIDLGGKGFNQAIATRRAGQALRFIAAVGIDSVADEIRASLMREGIDGKDLVVHDGQSDSSIILVDETGENLIVSGTARAEALAFQPVFAAGDTLLNAAPFREWLPEMAEHIDILVVNELELYLWTGRDPSHPLDAVMQAARVNTVVTTLGSKGCLLRLASGAMHSIAIPQTNVIDTTGAGDVFTGTYVSEWMASRNHLQAATLAVHVASDKVRRLGSSTAFPSTETIDRLRRQIYVALPLPQATP